MRPKHRASWAPDGDLAHHSEIGVTGFVLWSPVHVAMFDPLLPLKTSRPAPILPKRNLLGRQTRTRYDKNSDRLADERTDPWDLFR